MKNLFFTELMFCCKALHCYTTDEVERILTIYNKLIEFAQIGRNEGLLQLEDAANELKGDYEIAFLKKMILLLTWGTEPEQVEEYGLASYCAKPKEGIESLAFLMIIRGTLLIQEGNPPSVVNEQIYAMLPRYFTDIIDEQGMNTK